MNTAHQVISAHIRDLLLQDPALADGRVSLQRRRPMPQAVDSQIFVYLEDSTSAHVATSTEWETRVAVDCVARDTATPPLTAEVRADELAFEVHQRVMQSKSLDGRALNVMCHLQWTEDEAETTVAAAKVLCIVRHRTQRTQLSS